MVTSGCTAGQGAGRRGLCRARESTAHLTLSTSHSPTVVPEWVLPACLFQAGQDHLPWQGAEWSFQQARGSERAAVPRLGDQLMENSIASWVLQMLKTERS